MTRLLSFLFIILMLAPPARGSSSSGSGRSASQVYPWAQAYPPGSTTYYVAPNGAGATCSIAAPCSISLLSSTSLAAGTVVYLRGGLYYLTSTIAPMTTSGTSGSPVVFAAYPGETPIITGAQPLSGWTPSAGTGYCPSSSVLPPGTDCWSAVLPSSFANFDYLIYAPAGWPTNYLPYVMGRRTESVGTPNGYHLIAADTPSANNMDVYVYASDVPASWLPTAGPHHAPDVRFYNFRNVNVDALRMTSGVMQPSSTEVDITLHSPGASDGFSAGGRYLIVNSAEYFQSNAVPGTFYVDCTSTCVGGGAGNATIYYISAPGENPPTDTVLAPQLTQLVVDNQISGAAGAGYLTFQGLVFVGDNFTTGPGGYQSSLGANTIDAALSFVDTTGIEFDSCIVAHTSGWALEFKNDSCSAAVGTICVYPSAKNSLINSALYDIGASGLRLGRYPPNPTDDGGNGPGYATYDTTVSNDLFYGMGRIYPNGEAGCVWIGSSNTNTVEYNQCSDSYGGGVNIGPAVGFTTDYTYNNMIQYNNISGIGQGVIVDMGCVHIANYGGRANSTIGDIFQNNICHDVTHAVNDPNNPNGGTGIYFDANSETAIARYNLVYRASDALFYNSPSPSCPTTGCGNSVTGNIFAYSYLGAVKRGLNPMNSPPSGDLWTDFSFQNNFVYYDTSNSPLSLANGSSGNQWNCTPNTTNNGCRQFFFFQSNDYWSPTTMAIPGPFVTYDLSTGIQNQWNWNSSPSWNGPASNSPFEDTMSQNANPNFGAPGYPSDDYSVNNTSLAAMINFSTASFAPTYTAGRSNGLIFSSPTAEGFPLQLLSPFVF